MTPKTVNVTMTVVNDSGNGYSKDLIRFEDGTLDTSITPSAYAPVSEKESIPKLDDFNLKTLTNEGLVNSMDATVESTILKTKTTSELLVGTNAIHSGNVLTLHNVETNTETSDITIIITLVKIAYAALAYVLSKQKKLDDIHDIPSTINVSLANYLTCLPISEFTNSKSRDLLQKKLCKDKHTVTVKNFNRDVKVTISFNSDHTFIYPEGIAAQIGLIYSSDNYLGFRSDDLYKTSPYKNGKDYYYSGNTLLIDIGDCTTDISIFNKTHLLRKSISLNQGIGTVAATASDQLTIDYPQLGHYTRSIFLERALRDNREGKILRDRYLSPQIDLLMKKIETEVEKVFRKTNNDIGTVVILGGGVNLLTNKNKAKFQKILDNFNPLASYQKIWWIDSKYNQLLNLDGLHVLLTNKCWKN